MGAERTSELARDDARVFHVNDIRRVKTSLHVRRAWCPLHCDSLFLLQRLLYWRSPEPSHHREIWVLGFAGPYGLHYFIWGFPSSFMILLLQVYNKGTETETETEMEALSLYCQHSLTTVPSLSFVCWNNQGVVCSLLLRVAVMFTAWLFLLFVFEAMFTVWLMLFWAKCFSSVTFYFSTIEFYMFIYKEILQVSLKKIMWHREKRVGWVSFL